MSAANCSSCQKTLCVESIWLNVPPNGRKEIAEVVYCPYCRKTVGDARSLRSPKLMAHDWAAILGVIGKPPFYVQELNGKLLPAGMDLLTFERERQIDPSRRVSFQERAANDLPDEEPEREMEA